MPEETPVQGLDPDVVLALCSKLEATFDPGGSLPEDCAEWAEAHMNAIYELRGMAECALLGEE